MATVGSNTNTGHSASPSIIATVYAPIQQLYPVCDLIQTMDRVRPNTNNGHSMCPNTNNAHSVVPGRLQLHTWCTHHIWVPWCIYILDVYWPFQCDAEDPLNPPCLKTSPPEKLNFAPVGNAIALHHPSQHWPFLYKDHFSPELGEVITVGNHYDELHTYYP